MKRLCLAIVVLFFSACDETNVPESKIIESADIHQVEQELEKADQDSLVLFDCDGVLAMPKDKIAQDQNKQFLKKYFTKHNINGIEKDNFLTGLFLQIEPRCVNQKTVEIINRLQRKNIKVIVLTKLSSRPWGKIQDPIKWRIDMLNGLGYFFDKSIEITEKVKLGDIGDRFDPVFKSGIIFCGKFSKAPCLAAFIKQFHINPKKIFFIDDKKPNLEEVNNFCRNLKISFSGLEYTEVRKVNSDKLSEADADRRLNYFKQTGKLLSEN